MARLPTQAAALPTGDSFSPKSSFIEQAAYKADDKKLTLTFKNGSQYVYQDVPASTWLNFQQSPDHSSFYANAIKKTMQATPIKSAAVGQPRSQPLQKIKHERTLESYGNTQRRGIERITKRAGLDTKEPGTVPASLYSR